MATTTYTLAFGEVLSENRGGVEHDYLSDVRANVLELLDTTGSKTDSFDYWPYGEHRARTGTTETPYAFVGARGVRTDSSDRTHVGRRSGRTLHGRFVQREGLWLDWTKYSYGRANPTTWIDINGLQAVLTPEPVAPPGTVPLPFPNSVPPAGGGLGAGAAGGEVAGGEIIGVGSGLVVAGAIGVGLGYGIYKGLDAVTGGGYSVTIGGIFGVNGPNDAPPITIEDWCAAWAAMGRPCPSLPPKLGGPEPSPQPKPTPRPLPPGRPGPYSRPPCAGEGEPPGFPDYKSCYDFCVFIECSTVSYPDNIECKNNCADDCLSMGLLPGPLDWLLGL